VDFWLLFWACACGMGSGLVLLNNLGQLTGALGGGTDSQVSSAGCRPHSVKTLACIAYDTGCLWLAIAREA